MTTQSPALKPSVPALLRRQAVDPVAIALRSALLIGLIATIIYFTTRTDLFLTVNNLKNIALSSAVLLIVAVPEGLLVITGLVDLSVGSVIGLSGVLAGLLMTSHHVPWELAALAGIGVGALTGLLNGLCVAASGLSPIIVTLGTLQLARGVAQAISPNTTFGYPSGMVQLGSGSWSGLPIQVWIAIGVFLLGALVLYATPAGRYVYAIGVNREAAFLSGIATRRLPLLLFVATGAAAGLGGILFAARLNAAPSGTLGVSFELSVLTAVLLGGVAFNGGRGTVAGVLLGVAFLGVLQNGLTLINVSNATQQIVTGVVLVIAAGLDQVSQRSQLMRGIAKGRRAAPVKGDGAG